MTQYYVSTSGSDVANGLTTGTPWQTMAKVYNGSPPYSPGDIISFKRGDTWNEQLYLPPVSGTAGNPITYTAYGAGALPVINGPGGTGFGLDAENVHHITISFLNFKNWNNDGIYFVGECNNIIIEDCITELNGRHGLTFEASPGTSDIDVVAVNRVTSSKNFNAGFVCYNVSPNTTGIWFNYCKAIYNGQGVASHGFSGYYCSNIHWYKCEATLTNIDPITGNPNAYTTEGIGMAFDDFCSDSTMQYCKTHGNQGHGIAAGHQGSNNTIEYNLVVLNGYGIVINGDTGGSNNIKIRNNTVYANTGDALSMFATGASTGIEVKNNIFGGSTAGWGISRSGNITSYTIDTNIVYGNSSGGLVGISGDVNTITSNPTLAASYAPAFGSPALNAGLTLTNSYGLHPSASWPNTVTLATQGSTWDIGAFAISDAQYLRPISDIAAGGWTSTGASMFSVLDETVVDSGDYIYSPNNPTTQQFEVRLTSAVDPLSSAEHTIQVGLQAINLTTTFDLYLVQNTTVLDSWSETVTVAEGAVVRSRTFSGAVADAITDYTNLRVRGVARA